MDGRIGRVCTGAEDGERSGGEGDEETNREDVGEGLGDRDEGDAAGGDDWGGEMVGKGCALLEGRWVTEGEGGGLGRFVVAGI